MNPPTISFKYHIINLLLLSCFIYTGTAQKSIPCLAQQGNATQLIVDGKPYIILGGELGNSTFTSVESMKPVWPKLKAMNLNTVLAPVYWELIEPIEGKFDFKLLDDLIMEARNQDLRLILLWFGSWKNSMSSHVPSWVKTNQSKYPRAKSDSYTSQEILSPFGVESMNADATAYAALLQHLKEFDRKERTVIMMQPENEIGMLPSARDFHDLAEEKFKDEVPKALMDYLQSHQNTLVPEFSIIWKQNGMKLNGTWQEVFGYGLHTDEIFMAWYFAKYTEVITRKGKDVYPLPCFINAALNAPGKLPGQYPSAGPLPHLMDVWKAGAPSVDFISPDFYNPDFKKWNDLYTRQQNPLFIPEHRFDHTAPAKAMYAIGHYEAIGFSPFSIESKDHSEAESLGQVYKLIAQLAPLITKHQGNNKINAVFLDKSDPHTSFILGDYEWQIRHSHTLGWEASAQEDEWQMGYGIFIQTGPKEYHIAGEGISATFKNVKNTDQITGILKNETGEFQDNKWKVYRHLNGDQTHQGRHMRIFVGNPSIQRLELYDYD